jgi:LysR family transcriptional activator of nhaA
MSLLPLNFHHLQYFYAVATDGNLTRTARRLRIAQSALSVQIRQLEEQLGQSLFARQGRRLVLTEAGRMAQAYAATIFAAGGELVATVRDGELHDRPLRVGAVTTLSRNFQESFVRPLLGDRDAQLHLVAGSQQELVDRLQGHDLDVVLANQPPPSPHDRELVTQLLARQAVSIVAPLPVCHFDWTVDLNGCAMVLPGPGSALRTAFDALVARHGITVHVRAEVDDMAMLRLLARDSGALALVPSVVVRDELRSAILYELCAMAELAESFYAITAQRKFQNPRLAPLLARDQSLLLQA